MVSDTRCSTLDTSVRPVAFAVAERDPVSGRTEKIEGSTGGTGDSTASETRIPNLGVAGMDEVTSAIITGNGVTGEGGKARERREGKTGKKGRLEDDERGS